MKYILIAILAVVPTSYIHADDSEEAVFENHNYDFGDYNEAPATSKAGAFGFENSTSQNETLKTEAVADTAALESVGPAPASDDEFVDELSHNEVNARTQAGFAAANGALPADDGSVSVNLRSKK